MSRYGTEISMVVAALVAIGATAPALGELVLVPSDPRAQYEVLNKSTMKNGHIELTVKRTGPSGVSYTRREINCRAGTVRYLGEGDTLAEAKQNSPEATMTVPVPQSITGVITRRACGR